MNYLRLLQLRRMAADGVGVGVGVGAGTEGAPPAQDSAQSAQSAQDGTPAASEEGETADKTFTQADIDRVVAATIKREREKADKLAADARTEGEKLAKMTADQRAQHEREGREAAIAKREADVTRRELRNTAIDTLREKGLPDGLADLLHYDNADACNESITAMETVWRRELQAAVEARLKGTTPKAGGESAASYEASLRASMGLK